MRFPVPIGVLFLLGCGQSWEGIYRGSATQIGRCSDGSGIRDTFTGLVWDLNDNGDHVEVLPRGGSCGAFRANFDSGKARIVPKDCPVQDWDGWAVYLRFSGGTLELDEDRLTGNVAVFINIPGAGSCTADQSPNLVRDSR